MGLTRAMTMWAKTMGVMMKETTNITMATMRIIWWGLALLSKTSWLTTHRQVTKQLHAEACPKNVCFSLLLPRMLERSRIHCIFVRRASANEQTNLLQEISNLAQSPQAPERKLVAKLAVAEIVRPCRKTGNRLHTTIASKP